MTPDIPSLRGLLSVEDIRKETLRAAEQLQTLASEFEKSVRRLPSAAQRKFSQTKALAWEDLATPRDLLSIFTALKRAGALYADLEIM